MRSRDKVVSSEYSITTESLEEEENEDLIPNFLLPLVTLKFTPTHKPTSLAHVIVSKYNEKRGNENWKGQVIIHKKIKEYLDENENDRFEIRFVHFDNICGSIYTRFDKSVPTMDEEFLKLDFIYPNPIKSGFNQDNFKTFSIRVGFASCPKIEQHLFHMVIFTQDFPQYYKQKIHKSYYETLNEREHDKNFIQFWNYLSETRMNQLIYTDYSNTIKKDAPTSSLFKDPWFCLFTMLEYNQQDSSEWIEKLKKLNSNIDWDYLNQVSKQFFKGEDFNLTRRSLRNGLKQIMGEVSYFATLDSITEELMLDFCKLTSKIIRF